MIKMVRKSNPVGVAGRASWYGIKEKPVRNLILTGIAAKVLGSAVDSFKYAGDNLTVAKDYFISKADPWTTGLPDINPLDAGEQMLYGTGVIIAALGTDQLVRKIIWPGIKAIPAIFSNARRASNAKLVARKTKEAEKLKGPAESAGAAYQKAVSKVEEISL
jgi:hypothetical protein